MKKILLAGNAITADQTVTNITKIAQTITFTAPAGAVTGRVDDIPPHPTTPQDRMPMMKTRTLAAAIAAAALALPAAAAPAAAQATDTIQACYVPVTGNIYRIGTPNTQPGCFNANHVQFQWLSTNLNIRNGNLLRLRSGSPLTESSTPLSNVAKGDPETGRQVSAALRSSATGAAAWWGSQCPKFQRHQLANVIGLDLSPTKVEVIITPDTSHFGRNLLVDSSAEATMPTSDSGRRSLATVASQRGIDWIDGVTRWHVVPRNAGVRMNRTSPRSCHGGTQPT